MAISLESPSIQIANSLYEFLTDGDSMNLRTDLEGRYPLSEWHDMVMTSQVIFSNGLPVGTVRIVDDYLGFWVARSHRGTNIAYQACQLALVHVNNILEAGCWVENLASRRILARLNFREHHRYSLHGKEAIAWIRD